MNSILSALFELFWIFVGYTLIFMAVYHNRDEASKIKTYSIEWWKIQGLVLIGVLIIRFTI